MVVVWPPGSEELFQRLKRHGNSPLSIGLAGFPPRLSRTLISTSATPTAAQGAGPPTSHVVPLAPQSLASPIRYPYAHTFAPASIVAFQIGERVVGSGMTIDL